ncbi:MAG: hypothetical protein IPQ07_37435 [Myxococcales bacterium]|nr:hypothetical protein [Myxococcales bacterium]
MNCDARCPRRRRRALGTSSGSRSRTARSARWCRPGTRSPALTWSPALAATAAAWVAQCGDVDAPMGLVDHSAGRSTGHPYYVSENIYASLSGSATGQEAVTSWASRAPTTFANNTCAGTCGHLHAGGLATNSSRGQVRHSMSAPASRTGARS